MSERFLHVLESFAPGGIETTFLHVLREFRLLDPSVEHHVLAFSGGALESSYRAAATRVTVDASERGLDSCLAERPGVVHLLFERCAYRLMPKLVGHSAAAIVYGKGYDLGAMYRMGDGFLWHADESMCAAADRVTFTTAQLAAEYDVPAGRTTVLRKAAAVRAFAAIDDVNASTPPRILCVANLHARKRLGDLVRALPIVHRTVPGADLRFAGGGNEDERARLARLGAELGVSGHVSYAGVVSDVASEMAQARVVALPSAREGVSTSLLEAMAAGRPVVAMRTGHVDSIVDDGVEGFLLDVGDLHGLAQRLGELLADPDRCATMGAAARRRAARHDVPAVANYLLATLQEAGSTAAAESAAARVLAMAG